MEARGEIWFKGDNGVNLEREKSTQGTVKMQDFNVASENNTQIMMIFRLTVLDVGIGSSSYSVPPTFAKMCVVWCLYPTTLFTVSIWLDTIRGSFKN